MNKELASKICEDFRAEKQADGKTRCRSYGDGGLCKRPEYFRCELLTYSESEERKKVTVPNVSVSKVNTILKCPRLYALTYVYATQPPLPAKWKIVGRAFSDCSAKIDMGIGYELRGEIDSMPVDKARVSAILRRYQEWRRTDFGSLAPEYRVSFNYKDAWFLGYADRITTDKKTIIEWKYASTKYDELKALRQAAVYLYGIPEAEKFVLAVAKKPLQKLKGAPKPTKTNPSPNDETPSELEQRIYEELSHQNDTFTYQTYYRSFFDIESTIEQLYQASRLIKAYEVAGYPPVLSQTCDNCDYRPYCLKHLTHIGCDEKCGYSSICKQIDDVRKGETKLLPAKEEQQDSEGD